MEYYPYQSPIVLTDAIFLLYGGQVGTSTVPQRQAAYTMAEEQVTDYLASFLVPTIVTETHFWRGQNPVVLEYGHLISVRGVAFSTPDGRDSCSMSMITGCYAIRGNGTYGYLDVAKLVNCGGCSSVLSSPPYNVQVEYESGLSTGTVSQASFLMALTMTAQINLNEIDVSLSNEGASDIGITQFTNQKYTEIRMRLGNTIFGNSPMANRIARNLSKYRSRPSLGFH